eukprot:gene39947-49375_t
MSTGSNDIILIRHNDNVDVSSPFAVLNRCMWVIHANNNSSTQYTEQEYFDEYKSNSSEVSTPYVGTASRGNNATNSSSTALVDLASHMFNTTNDHNHNAQNDIYWTSVLAYSSHLLLTSLLQCLEQQRDEMQSLVQFSELRVREALTVNNSHTISAELSNDNAAEVVAIWRQVPHTIENIMSHVVATLNKIDSHTHDVISRALRGDCVCSATYITTSSGSSPHRNNGNNRHQSNAQQHSLTNTVIAVPCKHHNSRGTLSSVIVLTISTPTPVSPLQSTLNTVETLLTNNVHPLLVEWLLSVKYVGVFDLFPKLKSSLSPTVSRSEVTTECFYDLINSVYATQVTQNSNYNYTIQLLAEQLNCDWVVLAAVSSSGCDSVLVV